MFNVSIITPVYNVERCIEKTINSVKNQTLKNFELLLIDDGSKDRSIEIAENLLKDSDVNYKIITQENSGVSAARNRGIKEAEGEYICFLDSDDYIHEDYIKLMYDKASKYDCDLVFCDYTHVDGEGKVLIPSTTKFLKDSIDGKQAALKQLNGDITIGMGSALYRKSIIDENKILFDTNRKYAEDVVFTIKSLINMKKIMSVDKSLMYYVRWDLSATKSISLKHLDCYYSYVDLLNYLKAKQGFEEIERFLVEFKIPYAISHVFSMLSRDEQFHKNLFEFLNTHDVKSALKRYKIQKLDKNNIRYFVQCKGILYAPKVLLSAFKKLK